jgi:hypothetical protein
VRGALATEVGATASRSLPSVADWWAATLLEPAVLDGSPAELQPVLAAKLNAPESNKDTFENGMHIDSVVAILAAVSLNP